VRPSGRLLRGPGTGLALLSLLACTTPLDEGDRHYRAGDRLAALEAWREVPEDDGYYADARRRISDVEEEFHSLVVRYKQRARYYESHDQLAESILNYRLALKLQPQDRETLNHVQELSRTLSLSKAETLAAFHGDLEQRELAPAREKLDRLGALDPFDPELETERRQFNEVLQAEIELRLERGQSLFEAGELERAQEEFGKVLALDPDEESARGYLSYIGTLRSVIRGSGARLSSLDPTLVNASSEEIRAEGLHQNALAAERAGDPYTAIRHDLSALRADPDHEKARVHLAGMRKGLSPQLEGLIESGREYYLREDLESALDQWERALLIDPNDERARDYVERAHRLLENLDKLRADPQGGAR